jgi:hypothetical protein
MNKIGVQAEIANSLCLARKFIALHEFDGVISDYHLNDGYGTDALDMAKNFGIKHLTLISGCIEEHNEFRFFSKPLNEEKIRLSKILND